MLVNLPSLHKGFTLLIVAVLCIGAVPPAAAQGRPSLPRYEPAACLFPIPAGARVECGFLVVPEVRGDPTPRLVRLHVAIFRAERGRATADPIIYLEGGPGGSALQRIEARYAAFKPFMQDRDFILYDQRGAGYSTPSLQCPELLKVDLEALTNPTNGFLNGVATTRAINDCRARLEKSGVTLSAYNTNASSRDLEDLRRVLGIRRWNLFGISYGTRLALVTMRDFPAGIRSVILDSSYPLDRNVYGQQFGPAASRSLDKLFTGCQRDSACNKQYPNLRRVYNDLIRQLNRAPVTINTELADGQPFRFVLTGGVVQEVVISALYATAIIPDLPGAIYEARDGDYSYLTMLVVRSVARSQSVSLGMYYAVMCGDRSLPTALCNLWRVSALVPEQPRPVTSSIPTLILAGEYDPVTPPEYGSHAAETLRNGYYYEFPGFGHGISVSGACAASLTLRFLENPRQAPDSTCLTDLAAPHFTPRYF